MDTSTSSPARERTTRGLLVILVGLATVALPAPAAAVAGLTLLYAIAGLSILSGGVNFVHALRVREVAGWLVPVSLLVLALGVLLLASPVGVGIALTRVLGVAVVVGGVVTLVRAIRRERTDRTGVPPLPAAR